LTLPGSDSVKQKYLALAEDGDRLYVWLNKVGIYIYDITLPLSPHLVGTIAVETSPFVDLDVKDGWVLLTNAPYGQFVLIDAKDGLNPVVVTKFLGATDGRDVVLSGQYAFVAAGDQGLAVIDLAGCW
jgi:hypothetical protein